MVSVEMANESAGRGERIKATWNTLAIYDNAAQNDWRYQIEIRLD